MLQDERRSIVHDLADATLCLVGPEANGKAAVPHMQRAPAIRVREHLRCRSEPAVVVPHGHSRCDASAGKHAVASVAEAARPHLQP
eukprot:2381667-Prymnesium_polylepis.4